MINQWIPVEEMLPEQYEDYKGKKNMNVLVTTEGGKVTSVQRGYDSCCNIWRWRRIHSEVTAWMPLPKGYKVCKK